jgi:hypothetical protein
MSNYSGQRLISRTVPSWTSNLKKDKDFTRDDSEEKMGEDSMQAPEYHQRVGDVKPPVHLKKQQAENGSRGPLKGFDDNKCPLIMRGVGERAAYR